MRILLINPPQILLRSVGRPSLFQPTGLAYVAAVLEKEHEVLIYDACAEADEGSRIRGDHFVLGVPFDDIEARIREVKPDVVGVSIAYSVNEYAGLETAAVAKRVDPGIVTILGGPHPSIRSTEVASNPDVDFVVINEGEHTAPELLQVLSRGGGVDELRDVQGIAFEHEGEVVTTTPRPLIDDLDSLPFPARHLLPMERYHKWTTWGTSRIDYHPDPSTKPNGDLRCASVITSRGCPFKCNFCSIFITMGRPFRKRSAENVLEEIGQLVNDYGVNHMDFEDDNLTFDKKRLRAICDGAVERNHVFTWSGPNGLRADIIDEPLVISMKKSGCYRLFVAPESGVQDVVDNIIEKSMRLTAVENAVRLFSKHGVMVDAAFVFGSVGKGGRVETKREMFGTVLFGMKLKRLGLTSAGFSVATPLHGTNLRRDAEKYGYLVAAPDATDVNEGKPRIVTPEFTYEQVWLITKIGAFLINMPLKQKMRVVWKHRWDGFKYLKYLPTMAAQAVSRVFPKAQKSSTP